MSKKQEVWMPHPGHFICGQDCRFHLTTYTHGYIVSTLGELLPDSGSWDIYAKSKGITLEGRGDARRYDFLKRVGYVEVGCGRKYETMVFKAKKSNAGCCLWEMSDACEIDSDAYNKPEDAFAGHMKMLAKYRRRPTPRSGREE